MQKKIYRICLNVFIVGRMAAWVELELAFPCRKRLLKCRTGLSVHLTCMKAVPVLKFVSTVTKMSLCFGTIELPQG